MIHSDSETMTSSVQLFVLGQFRAERSGEPVPGAAWQGRKTRALVKLLCLERQHRLHKEMVQDLLWPDLKPAAADAAFRKTLHYARKAIDPSTSPSVLLLVDRSVSLDMSRVTVDLDSFEAAVEAAARSGDLDSIRAASELWRGELLPDDVYEDWSAEARERVRALYLTLLREGGRLAVESSEHQVGIELLIKAVRIEPEAEDVHRRLMQLYALAGMRSAALNQFEICRRALESEVDAEPDAETVRLFDQIRQGGFPPAMISEPVSRPPLPRAKLPESVTRAPATSFIGRSRPLELILASWGGVAHGSVPRFIAVRGEAGVGKTRLMAEAARAVGAVGGGVLWGGCYEPEGQSPYGPFVEAMETYLHSLTDRQRASAAAGYPELAHLLPALGRLTTSTSRAEVDRSRLFDATARFLAEIAGETTARGEGPPLLLALDDVHNADASTVALIHYLSRLDGDRPWLVVATFREEAMVQAPASSLISTLLRSDHCREIDLFRLSEEGNHALVRSELTGIVDQEVLDHVFHLGLGNPLFTRQLVASMIADRQIVSTQGAWILAPEARPTASFPVGPPDRAVSQGVPKQIEQLVRHGLEKVSVGAGTSSAAVVLGLAATLGVQFDFDELQTAASKLSRPVPEVEVVEALEAGVKIGLLECWGRQFAFRHPLLASATRDAMSQPRRTMLHRAVGASIEDRHPEQVELLAYHLREAGEPARACDYLEQAGDLAARTFANEAAAMDYGEALRLMAELSSDPTDVARVRTKLGQCLGLIGKNQEAATLLREAVQTYGSVGDPNDLLLATALLARTLRQLGEVDEAFSLVDAQIAEAGSQPSRGNILLHTVHATLLGSYGEYQGAERSAAKAVALARAAGDPALEAAADLRVIGAIAMNQGAEAARRSAQQSLPFVEKHAGLETLMRTIHTLSWAEMMLGNIEATQSHMRVALDVARRMGDVVSVATCTGRLGHAAAFLGNLPEGRRLIDEASALLSPGEAAYVSTQLLFHRGQIECLAGSLDEAAMTLTTVQALAHDSRDVELAMLASYWLSEIDLLQSHTEAAVDRLEELIADKLPPHAASNVTEHLLLMQLGLAYAQSHDGSAGLRGLVLTEHAVDYFRRYQYVLYLISALRAHGRVLIALGRTDEGLDFLQQALELGNTVSYPWAEFFTLSAIATAKRESGEMDEGAPEFSRAAKLASDLGAPQWVPLLESATSRVRPRTPIG